MLARSRVPCSSKSQQPAYVRLAMQHRHTQSQLDRILLFTVLRMILVVLSAIVFAIPKSINLRVPLKQTKLAGFKSPCTMLYSKCRTPSVLTIAKTATHPSPFFVNDLHCFKHLLPVQPNVVNTVCSSALEAPKKSLKINFATFLQLKIKRTRSSFGRDVTKGKNPYVPHKSSARSVERQNQPAERCYWFCPLIA